MKKNNNNNCKIEYYMRYSAIINRIKRSNGATFEEISDYLDELSELNGYDLRISKRTFQRDLQDILSLYGIEIYYDFSSKKWMINETEECRNDEKRLMESFDIINSLKLSRNVGSYISFEKRRNYGTDLIVPLVKSIQNRRMIRIRHQKYQTDEIKEYILKPYGLKESQHRWYLVAMDTKDNNLKTFGLDRIIEIEETRKPYTYPNNFCIEDYFSDCFGIINPQSVEAEIIELSFDSEQGKYLKTLPLHKSQEIIYEDEDEIHIRLKMKITYDFIMELLSHIESLKVIKPITLKEQLRSILKDAMERV